MPRMAVQGHDGFELLLDFVFVDHGMVASLRCLTAVCQRITLHRHGIF
jgi:hypothetical protein